MSPDDACTVAGCTRPADDGFVCRACTSDLAQQLDETGWLLSELNLVVSHQTQYGNPFESRTDSGDDGFPVNLTASDVIAHLVITLQIWVRRLLDENPHWMKPGQDVRDYADWLESRVDTIRCHKSGNDLVESFDRHVRAARHVIDRPPDRWYAGVCSALLPDGEECPEDLYANTTEGSVSCRRCGTHHDIAQRRATLLTAAEDVLATASEAARAIVVWSDYERGETRLVRRISSWAERGRIVARGHRRERGRARPTYRIGDILDLLAAN